MDIVLKGDMDGIEAASEIRNRLDVPIIYLTAYSDEETLKRARATSPNGYLIKPYHKEELNSVIQVALEQKKSEDVREKNLEEKVTSKQQELKIEKTGVFFISSLILSMAAYGFATRSMTWLEYLLFIPAIYNLIIVSISFKTPKKPDKPPKLPMVSILIPAHNEGLTIERCVRSIAELNYHEEGEPLYEIIVINDGSTDQTGDVLRNLKKEVKNLKIVTRKPPRAGKGKGHVLNDGYRISRGDVIAVFDADAKVKPDFLQKIIPYLDDEDVVGVQARVRMYNAKRNLLTAMQEVEFSIFGNVVLRARDVIGITGFLGGNGQLTTRKVIEEIGGWDGFAVTEDLNMSIKLMIKGYKIRYCGEAEVWQEAVPQWKPFFRQRVRWATGNLETLFVYLNSIIDAKIPIYSKIDSIQYLFFLLLTAFVMIGYMVAILSLGHVFIFKMTAPIIIGILSTLAFFPGVMVGIYRDNKNIPKAFLQTVEYWAYCLYLVPLFIAAFLHMLTRTERHWAKTRHTGEVESEFQKNKIITQKTVPEILKTDIKTSKR
jgi:cellulose synthase/poly-beta-1,6-N-acetylglucosamine synthase-like glycosyltransferase